MQLLGVIIIKMKDRSFNMSPTMYSEFKALTTFVDVKIRKRKKYLTYYLFREGNTKEPKFEIKST